MSDFISRIFKATFFFFCLIRIGNPASIDVSNNNSSIQGLNNNNVSPLDSLMPADAPLFEKELVALEESRGNVFHKRQLLQAFKPTVDGKILESESKMSTEEIKKRLKTETDVKEFKEFLMKYKFKSDGSQRSYEEKKEFLTIFEEQNPDTFEKFMQMATQLSEQKEKQKSSCAIL